jgi:glutamine amidotransferase
MRVSVAIVDNGGANIASLKHALARIGCVGKVSADAQTIEDADRVLLPGVGAAAEAMQRLRDQKLVDVIRNLRQPVLGICLGMQLLAAGSEEEDVECLGIFPGIARRLAAGVESPVPNMGWCPVRSVSPVSLPDCIREGEYFYFIHSYALTPDKHTCATAVHQDAFAALSRRENFVAAQFHPERSAHAGAALLRGFVEGTL